MAADKNRSKGKKEPKELYLKVPYHILNIPGLGLCEKVLLAHIYSFGEEGCWQSNADVSFKFQALSLKLVGPRTISLWISKLARSNLIQTKSPSRRKCKNQNAKCNNQPRINTNPVPLLVQGNVREYFYIKNVFISVHSWFP
jgi:hypothetical protein